MVQAELFRQPEPPVAQIPVALLRRLVEAAPAALRSDPEVAMLACELGVQYQATVRPAGIDPDWLAHAVACVRRAAASRPEITAEHVWPLLQRPPARPTDIGAALSSAAAAGVIERTERFASSNTSKVSGGRQKRIWRSLICR